MKITIYILLLLIIAGTLTFIQNKHFTSMAAQYTEKPYINNLKSSLGIDKD